MKKKIVIAVYVAAGLTFISSAYVASQRPKFRVDRCTTQLILLKGGYRTWGVNYCYGFNFNPDGSEKHHYHAPHVFHVDIRNLSDKEIIR